MPSLSLVTFHTSPCSSALELWVTKFLIYDSQIAPASQTILLIIYDQHFQGVGLFFFGVSEPLAHQSGNYYASTGYKSQNERDQWALNITMYHWGFAGWSPCTFVFAGSPMIPLMHLLLPWLSIYAPSTLLRSVHGDFCRSGFILLRPTAHYSIELLPHTWRLLLGLDGWFHRWLVNCDDCG